MTDKTKPEDFRMSEKEFDRIMGKALRVKPEEDQKPRKRPKAKTKKRPRQ